MNRCILAGSVILFELLSWHTAIVGTSCIDFWAGRSIRSRLGSLSLAVSTGDGLECVPSLSNMGKEFTGHIKINTGSDRWKETQPDCGNSILKTQDGKWLKKRKKEKNRSICMQVVHGLSQGRSPGCFINTWSVRSGTIITNHNQNKIRFKGRANDFRRYNGPRENTIGSRSSGRPFLVLSWSTIKHKTELLHSPAPIFIFLERKSAWHEGKPRATWLAFVRELDLDFTSVSISIFVSKLKRFPCNLGWSNTAYLPNGPWLIIGGGIWYCDRLVYRQGLRHLFLPRPVFAMFDIYIAKQFLCNPMNSQTHNHQRGPQNCWLPTLKVISITCISLVQVSMDAFFFF